MALVTVPRSVLNKIRQLIFEFLWSGGGSTQHYHLCGWEVISKPKSYGGWGLRNLFHFNLALAANSLWRVLTKQGIWHKVIKDKYLPYTSVTTWLRSATTTQPSASQTWKNLTKSLPLITHWLSWFPGNGQSILLGQDIILGNGSISFLSPELLVVLRDRNLRYLYQARAQNHEGFYIDRWKSSSRSGTVGSSCFRVESFCNFLLYLGIHLQHNEDLLIWTRGDNSGNLSVKMFIYLYNKSFGKTR
jgi:hypothetical protein